MSYVSDLNDPVSDFSSPFEDRRYKLEMRANVARDQL
jgi:hypothetical protein